MDERLTQTDYLLRIYHNHQLLGCSFDIYVLRSAANDDKYVADDEFISIYEDDFELIEGLISPYIEDWDIYDNDNELSIKDLRISWIEAQKIIEDLENGIMTDMLWSHCKKLNLSRLDKEVAVAERELFNNEQIEETAKREMSREIQLKAIFKHKDKLIRFIRAFYWFFFEHLKLDDDDDAVINIVGY